MIIYYEPNDHPLGTLVMGDKHGNYMNVGGFTDDSFLAFLSKYLSDTEALRADARSRHKEGGGATIGSRSS